MDLDGAPIWAVRVKELIVAMEVWRIQASNASELASRTYHLREIARHSRRPSRGSPKTTPTFPSTCSPPKAS